MRRTVLFFAAIVLMTAATASAQFLGQMSPASVLPTNAGKVGGYIVSAEDAFAVVGSFRYGFSPYTEGRFRLGFIDQEGPDTDPHAILGVDAKYLLWKFSEGTSGDMSGGYNNPIDLSLGAGMEYAALEGGNVLGLGGSVIASRPFVFRNGSSIEPYSRLNLRYQRNEADDYYDQNGVRHDGRSDSDFEIGLNLGALFSVTPLVDITAEFQLDDQNAFMIGIDIAAF